MRARTLALGDVVHRRREARREFALREPARPVGLRRQRAGLVAQECVALAERRQRDRLLRGRLRNGRSRLGRADGTLGGGSCLRLRSGTWRPTRGPREPPVERRDRRCDRDQRHAQAGSAPPRRRDRIEDSAPSAGALRIEFCPPCRIGRPGFRGFGMPDCAVRLLALLPRSRARRNRRRATGSRRPPAMWRCPDEVRA